jgi:hypothetical protein
MRTEGRRNRHDKLSQVDTLAHTETVGFEEFGHCEVAYEQCHKLLTDRCALIAEHGGVARELSPTDRLGEPQQVGCVAPVRLLQARMSRDGKLAPPCPCLSQ